MVNELSLYRNINFDWSPNYIAAKIDDNFSPVRMNSMTNNTYKVKVNGRDRVIRLPGKGTNRFIDRSREIFILNREEVKKISPKVVYHSTKGVLVTEYLPSNNYRIMSSDDSLEIPAKLLGTLHRESSKYEIVDKLKVDLVDELLRYKKIYSNSNVEVYEGFDSVGGSILEYLSKHQHDEDTVLCHRDLMYNNIMISSSDSLQESKLLDWEYSGYLNLYWDLGCFLSEYLLWFTDEDPVEVTDKFLKYYSRYNPITVDLMKVIRWRYIVDYVWSSWSLAKTALGDDNYDYGKSRFVRSINFKYKDGELSGA